VIQPVKIIKYGTTAGLLKPLDELCLPDPRFEHERLTLQDGDRAMNAEDIYERLEFSHINSGVPERIRTQFEVSRNLMLYAYFVFEFQTQAELQAYAALEYALRERFGRPTREIKRDGKIKIVPLMLAELLQKAVGEKLVLPEQLPSFEWANQRRRWFADNYGGEFVPLAPREWLEMVQKHITDLRNHIAHGNPQLHLPASFTQIELCADIINALFHSTNKTEENNPPV
jgi:hypothetical protein